MAFTTIDDIIKHYKKEPDMEIEQKKTRRRGRYVTETVLDLPLEAMSIYRGCTVYDRSGQERTVSSIQQIEYTEKGRLRVHVTLHNRKIIKD